MRSFFGLIPDRACSADSLGDGGLHRHQMELRRRKALVRTILSVRRPCAATTGSLPSVSTSSMLHQQRVSTSPPDLRRRCGHRATAPKWRRNRWRCPRQRGILLPRLVPVGRNGFSCGVDRRGVGRFPCQGRRSSNARNTRRSTCTAPALSSGSLPFPHFGDCTHDGQPPGHSHASMASAVAFHHVRI